MATISEALAIAIQHHQAGQLNPAEQIYRQILETDPNHPHSLCYLGVIASQVGKHAIAMGLIDRAIQLNGDVAEFHNNLGNVKLALGRMPDAIDCYRRALTLKPDFADAYKNLGNALKDHGELDEAVDCYRQALHIKPDLVEASNNLATILQNQGKIEAAIARSQEALELSPGNADAFTILGNAFRAQEKLDQAAECYRRAIAINPNHAYAFGNLGAVLGQQREFDEAITCSHRAIELKPDFANAYINLGNALKEQGDLDEAISVYRRALELNPDDYSTYNNLGAALRSQGRLNEAIACYRRALELDPDFAEAHTNLGLACKEDGRLDEAVACYQKVVELKPDSANAHNNLGIALGEQGKLDQAIGCYRRAVELKPDYAIAHSNLLIALQYCEHVSLASLFSAHADYDRQHAYAVRDTFAQREKDMGSDADLKQIGVRPRANVRPRIGFVSRDFGQHPVGFFLIGVLENLRREQVELYCYSDRVLKDELTLRIQSTVTQWRDVFGLSDAHLAEQIRADGIDILFDLAGHTMNNRMLVFARKPAPIQITWAGYVGTTGLKAIDYILADRYEIPSGHELYYHEQVLRMPDGYICYAPPVYAPSVTSLPSSERGHVTFGCFNNHVKITRRAIKVWSEILKRLPGSRMVMKFNHLDDPSVFSGFADSFCPSIDRERLEFQGASPHAELLAEYNRIDVALDTFPYSGGVTTCESLWMGVPVITCPGETFASRHSLSHLSNIGLTETIASSFDDYVERAVSLASDLVRLAELRAGLRERMEASPLCDAKRFASNLMTMLHDVWKSRSEK